MRGNLVLEIVIGKWGRVAFVEDDNGEYEVVGGGRITQRQVQQKNKNKCDVCGEQASHFSSSGVKGDMALCCKHHIERGGIPADWHSQCMKFYEEEKQEQQEPNYKPENIKFGKGTFHLQDSAEDKQVDDFIWTESIVHDFANFASSQLGIFYMNPHDTIERFKNLAKEKLKS